MKELKFRAWDKDDKVMIIPTHIDREGKGWYTMNSIPTCSSEIIQYTGRRDKNGNEIFEGDVVKRISLTPDYDDTGLPAGTYICGYSLKEKVFVASMDLNYDNPLLGTAYFPGVHEADSDFSEDRELYAEELSKVGDYIIGNIYENQEMLKGMINE